MCSVPGILEAIVSPNLVPSIYNNYYSHAQELALAILLLKIFNPRCKA